MSRPYTPKVVTANDLLLGDVIYQTASGDWTRDLAEAEVIRDEPTADSRLRAAIQQPGIAVGAYLAEVKLSANGPAPAHFREAFRATGPSNYFHGKQAAQA
ncbi:DUF2849 domain-containing protein [Seohaeicola nanhaiensis]|uniref:DUF2849 domain-containing protein n=1 Tax=Seohaeicola nanhaiensis TaxID=1387282 RepID=A0ABV9KG74_9RHOB